MFGLVNIQTLLHSLARPSSLSQKDEAGGRAFFIDLTMIAVENKGEVCSPLFRKKPTGFAAFPPRIYLLNPFIP